MDWDRAALRHEAGRIEHRLFEGIKQLAETRKSLDALHGRGQERILQAGNDRTFLFERVHEDNRLLVAANFAAVGQAVSLSTLPSPWQETAFTDVLGDRPAFFSSGRLVLPPYGYLWLQPSSAGDPRSSGPGVPVTTPIELEVHTEWGEEVYLCGNLEVLGAGTPSEALGPLSAADYPIWRAEVDVPAHTYFTFRWVKKRAGRVVEWSPHRYAVRAGEGTVWQLEPTE
jgi:hypothetical protein